MLLLLSGYGSSIEEMAVTSPPQPLPDESWESSTGHRIQYVYGSGRSMCISTPRSISPNFVCAEKSCRHTEFGKKITALFNQHSASNCRDEICLICKVKFANVVRCSANLFAVCQMPFATKSFSSCSLEKAARICWWNWPQVLILSMFYSVCHIFRLKKQMIIFGSILTTFESSSIFGGRRGSIENWLEPKIKPPSGNLACQNLRNDLY